MADEHDSAHAESNDSGDATATNVTPPEQPSKKQLYGQRCPSESTTAIGVARELHWLEKLSIVGQLSLVAVAASIYGCQLHTMNEQLEQMKGSSDQTGQIIKEQTSEADSTKQNAAAAKSFADSARNINAGIADAVRRLQAQSEALDRARKSSELNSKATLDATIELFHRQDRAWVGISEAKPIGYQSSDDGVTMTLALKLQNYGHSAAQHIIFNAILNSDPSVYSYSCDEADKGHLGWNLLPGQEHTVNWVMNLPSAQIAKGWSHQNPILGQKIFLRIFGCIKYTDKEGEPILHSTPFAYLVFSKADVMLNTPIPLDQLSLDVMGTDSSETR